MQCSQFAACNPGATYPEQAEEQKEAQIQDNKEAVGAVRPGVLELVIHCTNTVSAFLATDLAVRKCRWIAAHDELRKDIT